MTADRSSAGSPAPIDHYAPELNALERNALGYLRARTRASGEPPLEEKDRAELSRIRRRVVAMGVASGTFSGLLLGGLEVYLRVNVISDERGIFDDPLVWGAFYAFVGVLTVVEILFLYWVALRAISGIREVVGIAIKRSEAVDLVETGLTLSALEMPNPHREIYGVDPYAFVPRWKLVLWNLLYRAKVGATSFVLRVVMRRVAARALLRSYIPLVAAPLYAGWNAYILWRMMNEALLRALGPFAVRQAVEIVSNGRRDKEFMELSLAAAREMIRRSGDAHPNYVLLLFQMSAQDAGGMEAGWPRHRSRIGRLRADAQEDFSRFLHIVAVLAGGPSREQAAMLEETHERMALPYSPQALAGYRKRLLSGRPLQGGVK